MTAISKTWVTIGDGAVDPDSPVDTTLMTGLRDDLIHLREWLGASFTAGAVQNHNHDGSNSALIEVGPNLARNPSFEADTASWTITQYTGGTVAVNTANHADGAKSLAFTSTSTANGGGDAISAGFIAIAGGRPYSARALVKASVANVSAKAEIVWYDSAQAQISASTIFSSTNVETAFTAKLRDLKAPATARFAKIKITGGVPGSGSSAGTIYFDGIALVDAPLLEVQAGDVQIHSDPGGNYTGTTPTKVSEFYCPFSGVLRIKFSIWTSSAPVSSNGQIYINGTAVGTLRTNTSGTAQEFSEDIAVAPHDLVQFYTFAGAVVQSNLESIKVSVAAPRGIFDIPV